MMRSFGAGGGLTPNSVGTVRVLKYLNKSKPVRSGGVSVSETQDSFCPVSSFSNGDAKNDALATTSPSSPVSSNEHVWPTYLAYPFDGNEDGDWVCVDPDIVDTKTLYGHVFGSVPSPVEVSEAVSSLQRVLGRVSSDSGVKDESVCDYAMDESVLDDGVKNESVCELEDGIVGEGLSRTNSSCGTIIGSAVDWIEPSLQIYNSNPKMLQPYRGYDRVYDAFYMLQNEPAVQRMVASLASDNGVWDAVLNNEVVREIRDSFIEAAGNSAESSKASRESDNFFRSFIVNVKAKIKELINSFRTVVNGLTGKQVKDNAAETSESEPAFVNLVKASGILSMMVLLLVVLRRIEAA